MYILKKASWTFGLEEKSHYRMIGTEKTSLMFTNTIFGHYHVVYLLKDKQWMNHYTNCQGLIWSWMTTFTRYYVF